MKRYDSKRVTEDEKMTALFELAAEWELLLLCFPGFKKDTDVSGADLVDHLSVRMTKIQQSVKILDIWRKAK